MHLVYIDDSRDEAGCVFSALAIPADQWRNAFQKVRKFRRELKKSDGIFVYKEFHAWKFVSGRGEIADRTITKGRRCQIFKDTLTLVAELPGARLFNAVFWAKEDEEAFERLVNRINRTMQAWDSRAILICDEGKECAYTRLYRRMCVYNPIPSRHGVWPDTGEPLKNIPIEYIIEDLSSRSRINPTLSSSWIFLFLRYCGGNDRWPLKINMDWTKRLCCWIRSSCVRLAITIRKGLFGPKKESRASLRYRERAWSCKHSILVFRLKVKW